jgi:hypothetical protein
MAEKESKHIGDKYISIIPHSGMFIVSSNTYVYMKGCMKSVQLTPVEIKTLVLFSIGLTTAPSYLVVVVMQ